MKLISTNMYSTKDMFNRCLFSKKLLQKFINFSQRNRNFYIFEINYFIF